jgi:hypothetical protein
MQEVKTTANLVEYGSFDDGGSVTAVLARSDVEAALEDDAGLWFEIGYEDEDAGRLTIDLQPTDLEAILGQTEGDEVVLALDGDWVSGVFEDSDVEAHGLRGALAIAVVAGAIAAPAGLAATPQVSSASVGSQATSPAAESQVVRSAVVQSQVSSAAARPQVSKAAAKAQVSPGAKRLVVKQSGLKILKFSR